MSESFLRYAPKEQRASKTLRDQIRRSKMRSSPRLPKIVFAIVRDCFRRARDRLHDRLHDCPHDRPHDCLAPTRCKICNSYTLSTPTTRLLGWGTKQSWGQSWRQSWRQSRRRFRKRFWTIVKRFHFGTQDLVPKGLARALLLRSISQERFQHAVSRVCGLGEPQARLLGWD